MFEMNQNLGNMMVMLMRAVNIAGLSGNRMAHELAGVIKALVAMGIEFEFDYNDDVTEYTAVTLMGQRFEV